MAEGTEPTDRGPSTGTAASHGPRPGSSSQVDATLVPEAGWHVMHLFYRVDRGALARLDAGTRDVGREEVAAALDQRRPGAIEQMQAFVVPGHKADFGVVLAGPDLRAIRRVQTDLEASALGPALVPTYSFYSITEISEYVPTAEQYGELLRNREGMDPESPAFQTKVRQYASRLEAMNRQRITPEFPEWPCLCFYPMSKMRQEARNWYLLPFEERSELMAQHGRSGMLFAGRVSQVITASTGLDDWEWGVTLWAKNPQYLKEIVYTMRFDESSARYALFGDFYFGYLLPPSELLEEIRL